MTLTDLRDALLAILPGKVYHYFGHKAEAPYIVWMEDGQADATWADDEMITQALTGTVHLFTRKEFDPLFWKIQKALNGLPLSWRLNSVQSEEETKLTHYEWVWEVEVLGDTQD